MNGSKIVVSLTNEPSFVGKTIALVDLDGLAMNTYVDYNDGNDIQSVQKNLRETDWNKYQLKVGNLNTAATDVYAAYEALVRLARGMLSR